jgi:hypothetical protein
MDARADPGPSGNVPKAPHSWQGARTVKVSRFLSLPLEGGGTGWG